MSAAISRAMVTGALLAWIVSSPTPAQSTPGHEHVLELLESGRTEEAIHVLESRPTDEDDPVTPTLFGMARLRQGRFDEAEAAFRRALEIRPEFPEAREQLARLLLTRGRDREALETLREAAPDGLERDLALRLGTLELQLGDREAAARHLRETADRFGSVQALLVLSRIRSALGEVESARAALAEARELAPNSEAVLRETAELAIRSGEPGLALEPLGALTRMVPEETDYLHLLGLARMQIGDVSGAVEPLRAARALDPDRAAVVLALGLALNVQDRFSEAREILRDASRLTPDDPHVLAGWAEAEEGLGQFFEAEELARRALAIQPDHPIGNLVLGMARMRQGRHGEARDALIRAVESDPASPKAHYQLSLAYARLGDMERSKEQLEKYRRLLESVDRSTRPSPATDPTEATNPR